MASQEVWSDFETVRHSVYSHTVDRLKVVLSAFNDECGTNLVKSGKKQDIIDRIIRELEGWRRSNSVDKFLKAKNILSQMKANGCYSRADLYAAIQKPYAGPSTSGHATGGRNIPPFNPYAPPQRPFAVGSSASSSSHAPNIRFKPSPFYRVEQAVSTVVECPESSSQMDRRQQTLTFTITNDILQKLTSQSPKYQLRLYCTSSLFYTPQSTFRQNPHGLCPIEFPPTCEVRVNTIQLTANLKGMKKKPGTAPPPDLGKAVRLTNGAVNRVEMVYVNSQQPSLGKACFQGIDIHKYYLVVMLVEVTSVDQLIDRLKKGKYKTSNEILTKMLQNQNEEDDIVAGHQKMSLKCPLSYVRIAIPCRSSLCVHSQCFDAFSWYSVMEQTTTWMCPVCEKVLNVDDLIIDGFFDEILKATPEDIEDVIVEADGLWHTSDNLYGSVAWKDAHPPISDKDPTQPRVKERSPTPVKAPSQDINGKGKSLPSNAEIVILDSDDEDEEEGQVKRELSPTTDGSQRTGRMSGNPSFNSIATGPARTQESDVIDLTLDSDDEEPPSQSRPRLPPTTLPLTKKHLEEISRRFNGILACCSASAYAVLASTAPHSGKPDWFFYISFVATHYPSSSFT
ncbi:PINIT domain-containing protein [Abortiporus biennis]|nr:PINIT domain-containing protein [Abortiporus biennis]